MSEQSHTEQSDCVLKDYELDNLAAECAVPIAAAFSAGGWTWRRGFGNAHEEYTPDAALIAVRMRRAFADTAIGKTLSSGRVMVSRYVDEEIGDETAEVWLHVGTLHAGGKRS